MIKRRFEKKVYRHVLLITRASVLAYGLLLFFQPAYGQMTTTKADSLLQLAIKANEERRYNQAIYHLNLLVHQMDTVPVNRFNQERYRQLAEAYRGKKDYKKSFDAFHQYEQVYDAIFRLEKETDKQDQINKMARIEQEGLVVQQQILLKSNEAALEREQMWLAVMAAGLALLAGLCIFSYKSYQKKKKINEESSKAYEKKATLVALQAERVGMDQERQKITASLKQELFPLLEQISNKLTLSIHNELNEKDAASLQDVQTTVRQARTSLEGVLKDLSDTAALPLEKRISNFIKTLPESLSVTLDVQSKQTLPPKHQQIAFYIVQELLQNIMKHARASRAAVKLHFSEAGLKGEVSDNGIGMSGSPTGFGLDNIQRQLHAVHGRFEMKDYKGLHCIFFIPVNE